MSVFCGPSTTKKKRIKTRRRELAPIASRSAAPNQCPTPGCAPQHNERVRSVESVPALQPVSGNVLRVIGRQRDDSNQQPA